MATTTLLPDGDIATGSWFFTPAWSKINKNLFSSSSDSTYIGLDKENYGDAFSCSLQNTPSDLSLVTAVSLTIRFAQGLQFDYPENQYLYVQVFNGATALTNQTADLVAGAHQYPSNETVSMTLTGATQNKTNWDGAKVVVTGDCDTGGGSALLYVSDLKLVLTYTPSAAASNLFSNGFLDGLSSFGPTNFRRFERTRQILVPAMVIK